MDIPYEDNLEEVSRISTRPDVCDCTIHRWFGTALVFAMVPPRSQPHHFESTSKQHCLDVVVHLIQYS
ncbi:hypothetical protein RB195_020503 [Necator americanus]|uniref:Uncharacterized protein n=1 Tax=Necator americanus TaxID=51031 RepID=A0ABR1CKX3_NECAM